MASAAFSISPNPPISPKETALHLAVAQNPPAPVDVQPDQHFPRVACCPGDTEGYEGGFERRPWTWFLTLHASLTVWQDIWYVSIRWMVLTYIWLVSCLWCSAFAFFKFNAKPLPTFLPIFMKLMIIHVFPSVLNIGIIMKAIWQNVLSTQRLWHCVSMATLHPFLQASWCLKPFLLT